MVFAVAVAVTVVTAVSWCVASVTPAPAAEVWAAAGALPAPLEDEDGPGDGTLYAARGGGGGALLDFVLGLVVCTTRFARSCCNSSRMRPNAASPGFEAFGASASDTACPN